MATNRTGCRVLTRRGTPLQLHGPVGFNNLIDQTVKKQIKTGFELNIVVLGETALGKSTLMDSLFKTHFDEADHNHERNQVEVVANQYELDEGDTRLRLNICECVGYGDQLDRSKALQPIKNYITQQFQDYLAEEMRKARDMLQYVDTRCHVCLYLLAPTGHGIKSLDLVALKELGDVVNVLPVIAKADALNYDELQAFKAQVRKDLLNNDIKVYELPKSVMCVSSSDNINELTQELQDKYPFSVIASNHIENGQRVRHYPWGNVDVENPEHSDFVSLREVLLCVNTMDLINKTHAVHYAKFRRERLLSMGYLSTANGDKEASLQDTYERKHKEFLELRNKREMEMRMAFSRKVKDKEAELKMANHALKTKYETLRKQLKDDWARLTQQMGALDISGRG